MPQQFFVQPNTDCAHTCGGLAASMRLAFGLLRARLTRRAARLSRLVAERSGAERSEGLAERSNQPGQAGATPPWSPRC
jgi:hypothetical protein